MFKNIQAKHKRGIMSERKANALLFSAAIVWGWGFIAGKQALSTLNPFILLLIRFSLAAAFMGVIFSRRIKNVPRETVKKGFIIALFQAAGILVQLIGLQYTTTAKQAFLIPSYVVFVPFLSWIIFKENPGIKAIIAGIISIAGIGFITLNENFTIGLGDSISLCFAVIFGLEIIYISAAVTEDVDVIQMSFYEYVFISVFALVMCLFKGVIASDIFECFRVSFSSESLLGILYLGTFNTVYAFTIQNSAQPYSKTSTAALIMGLESVFGFLFSIIYYHEIITFRFLLGASLCFGAILLATVKKEG